MRQGSLANHLAGGQGRVPTMTGVEHPELGPISLATSPTASRIPVVCRVKYSWKVLGGMNSGSGLSAQRTPRSRSLRASSPVNLGIAASGGSGGRGLGNPPPRLQGAIPTAFRKWISPGVMRFLSNTVHITGCTLVGDNWHAAEWRAVENHHLEPLSCWKYKWDEEKSQCVPTRHTPSKEDRLGLKAPPP